jgi:CheY-like chemotaxis protein
VTDPTHALLIDDDLDIREAVESALDLAGYTVRTAANGAEGLALLGTIAPPCVILLDLRMPVMNGVQFRAAQLADPALRSIPVVVLSADQMDPAEAIRLGVPWLKKPVSLQVLLDTVAQYAGPPSEP